MELDGALAFPFEATLPPLLVGGVLTMAVVVDVVLLEDNDEVDVELLFPAGVDDKPPLLLLLLFPVLAGVPAAVLDLELDPEPLPLSD